MNSNIFSIAPDVIVSEKNFTRLNNWLRQNGFRVEEIPYAEEDNVYLEGTGSLILDREFNKAYCALSPRADEELFIEL